MMTPAAGLHFLTLAASLFGVVVALASAWRVRFGKRDVRRTPAGLPEGSYFLLFLCACIALLTHKHAGPVINGNLHGVAHTVAVYVYASALVFAGLHVLMGAHTFIGQACARHRNRAR